MCYCGVKVIVQKLFGNVRICSTFSGDQLNSSYRKHNNLNTETGSLIGLRQMPRPYE